jgi:biotin carboxyl carrier protein
MKMMNQIEADKAGKVVAASWPRTANRSSSASHCSSSP